MINPNRLQFARIRRAWSKAKLAKELGIEVRSIQGYELGEYCPEEQRLEAIALALNFPKNFFLGPDLPLINETTASFRSMSKMSATIKNSALSAGTLAFLLNEFIESKFKLPEADLPDLGDLSPEDAASSIRRIWGLGEAPIGNLIHLLESRGIRVYSLAINAREVDAFSVWHNNKPFIFLNTYKSAEHSRFDAAHELGHLLRDRHNMLHGNSHSPQMEREANLFASSFLMPRTSVIAHAPNVPTIDKLINLKDIWGVSLAALAYRMNQLSLFSEWNYRNLCIQIAKKGYRTNEPNPIRREMSQTLSKVFELLKQDGITKLNIANILNIESDEIDNLTFGLMISGLAASDNPVATTVHNKPNLTLVK